MNWLKYIANVIEVVTVKFPEFDTTSKIFNMNRINLFLLSIFENYAARRYQMQWEKLKFNDTWFAQSYLSELELEGFEDWLKTSSPDLEELLPLLTDIGMKLSLSWDNYNDCMTCSATCCDKKNDNFGGVMTARSNDPAEALYMVAWKVLVLYDGQSWPKQREKNSRG